MCILSHHKFNHDTLEINNIFLAKKTNLYPNIINKLESCFLRYIQYDLCISLLMTETELEMHSIEQYMHFGENYRTLLEMENELIFYLNNIGLLDIEFSNPIIQLAKRDNISKKLTTQYYVEPSPYLRDNLAQVNQTVHLGQPTLSYNS